MDLEVPSGVKVKVVVQRRDTIYFTIPPARGASLGAGDDLPQPDGPLVQQGAVHTARPRRCQIQAPSSAQRCPQRGGLIVSNANFVEQYYYERIATDPDYRAKLLADPVVVVARSSAMRPASI